MPIRPEQHLVRQVLTEYGSLVRSALDHYLPMAEPRRHLYELLHVYPRRGGKMLRPSLCLATARSFGGSLEDALRSAVAVEMLHNAMLIHDDIEDESEQRRGHPTLHAMFGVPLALNAGDMLTLLSLRPLIENVGWLGPQLTHQLIDETQRMAAESAEGQALELGWIRDNVLDLDARDYLEMVLKKTCWLATIHPMRSGSLIATRGAVDADPFIRFGFFLGAAFQIQDDVLNLIGDHGSYGKEIGGDLFEGKRTLILMHLWSRAGGDERARIREIFAAPRHERRESDIRWLFSRLRSYGSIEYAQQVALGLAGAALHEYEGIFGHLPSSRDKHFVKALIAWVIERHG